MFEFIIKNKKSFSTAAVIVAAGNSSRMNYQDKQFIDILGKPVLAHTLTAFQKAPSIDGIFVVSREQDILIVSDIIKAFNITKAVSVAPGGETRTESVKSGINAVGDYDYIAIHDGARPCVLPEHIDNVVDAAVRTGAAALGCPACDTLKSVDAHLNIIGTVERKGIWQIQTPQVFKSEIIKKAYEYAQKNDLTATDDCGLVELIGVSITVVEGTASNVKLTRQEDLSLICSILAQNQETS
ncbi:MAG: 2-C-methyl-D-erythritol 4-phosphate cytidylyltransferase [Clostridiaceae bacterium]|nr:2-C-methyl-D-erythritol 4-phosphate cytidylyltransferase [Clostridiaceae bacterium]